MSLSVNSLSASHVSVSFPVYSKTKGLRRRYENLQAVQDVSFDLQEGKTLGIVGESGCGKSTLARALLGLVPLKSGSVEVLGKSLSSLTPEELRQHRRHIQIIFQDPLASLDPRMTVGQSIAEPLQIFHPELSAYQMVEKVAEIMTHVGLSPDSRNRYPHEFSGGQCQRVGIARAMILKPKILVCDEPVSALDVSIQGQIINLLKSLQKEFNLSLIFISHDLKIVRQISHDVLVMYLGRVVEKAPYNEIYSNPRHPYTKALISCVLIPDPLIEKNHPRFLLQGEIPSPLHPPSGCNFRTRCPYATDICASLRPPLETIHLFHQTACHHWKEL